MTDVNMNWRTLLVVLLEGASLPAIRSEIRLRGEQQPTHAIHRYNKGWNRLPPVFNITMHVMGTKSADSNPLLEFTKLLLTGSEFSIAVAEEVAANEWAYQNIQFNRCTCQDISETIAVGERFIAVVSVQALEISVDGTIYGKD